MEFFLNLQMWRILQYIIFKLLRLFSFYRTRGFSFNIQFYKRIILFKPAGMENILTSF